MGRSSLQEAIKILSAIGVVQISVGERMFVGRGDLSLIARPLPLGLLMGERSTSELIEACRSWWYPGNSAMPASPLQRTCTAT
ncbi:MAG: hypothetical protein ABSD47_11140 [Candidatus Methylomirabilota bacterium]